MVMALKLGELRLLVLVSRLAPDGNTRLSSVAAEPVGAAPPCQLPPALQNELLPAPVQMNVAGASRDSNCSTCSRFVVFRCGLLRLRERVADPNHRRQLNQTIAVVLVP